MNIECFRETMNTLTVGEIIGDSAEYSVEDVCEALDAIKSLLKGGSFGKKNEISSNTPQKVMKLYSSNFTPEEIADMLNLTIEEVQLVTTTSDNEITAIAQRMYKSNMPVFIMSEVLGVPVSSIEQMFGMSNETDDEEERDLSLHINGYNSISGKSDDEDEDPASAFANDVFEKYVTDPELSRRERSALIDEQNFADGYDHTGH